MGKLTCEVCEGNDFFKENGEFVCRTCGMKYSLAELQSRMNSTGGATVVRNETKVASEEIGVEKQQSLMDLSIELDEEESVNNSVQPQQKNKLNSLPKYDLDEEEDDLDDEDDEDEEDKKFSLNAGHFIGIGLAAISIALFVVFLIMSITLDTTAGNVLLLISGLGELAVAYILYKIVDMRKKKICPECGAKRKHSREFEETTEREKNFRDSYVETYTHHYLDSYTCPECDTTLTVKVKKSGGSYTELASGKIIDKRREPKEF